VINNLRKLKFKTWMSNYDNSDSVLLSIACVLLVHGLGWRHIVICMYTTRYLNNIFTYPN